MKVAIYARVSKTDLDDPNSIPHQLREARSHAVEQGWEVVGEYVDEGISAFNVKKTRPEYERLINDLQGRHFDAPLAADFERLLRQDKEGERWLEMNAAHEARFLLFTDESDIDLNRSEDRKTFKERVARAVYYSERLSERIRRTTSAKAAAGEWAGGGRRPFGYRKEEIGRRSSGTAIYGLVIDKREASLIRAAARAVIGGASTSSIAREWNYGPEPVPKDSGSQWTVTDVKRVLTSEQVAGLRGGVTGTWKPILTHDQHEILLAIFNDPSRRIVEKTDKAARRWLLTGFVWCGNPGCKSPRMDGRVQNRATKTRGMQERRQYVCHAANGGCGKVGITSPDLERYVLRQAMERIVSMPELEPESERAAPMLDGREEELLVEMRAIEERKDAIGDALADGLDPRQAQRSLTKMDEQLVALRKELGQTAVKPLRTRKYLATLDVPDRFLDGEISELPGEWVHHARDLLDDLGAKVRIKKAKSKGIRFDPKRVKIAWS